MILLDKVQPLGQTVETGAVFRPAVAGGALILTTERVQLGTVDATPVLASALGATFDKLLAPINLALGSSLKSVTAEGGLLTLTFSQ